MSDEISLYYQSGSSDKVYHVKLEKVSGGFVVNFAFGRRGTTLQTGTKTSVPVSYDAAKKIMDSLVRSKKAKGYQEGTPEGISITVTKEERTSGVFCQLLNPIEEEEVQHYLENAQYGAQEKLDGHRTLIRKEQDTIEGINRKGLVIPVAENLHHEIKNFAEDFILDGEFLNNTLYVFDILSHNGKEIQSLAYQERYEILEKFFSNKKTSSIIKVALASTSKEKKSLLQKLKKNNKEGIVFKDLQASYQAGRPASGGSQVKFKFYETATVSVEKVNLKRSVSMRLKDGDDWISVGNVTIPPNAEIPRENEIIEVRYLYAYKGGSLYQPTYLGLRNDMDENDCVLQQLKYKG